MAEGGEKTEQATPRRRQDSRKKGQVARSPELAGAVALLAMIVTMHVALGNSGILEYLRHSLSTLHEHLNGNAPHLEVARVTRGATLALVKAVGLSILVGFIAAIIASVAQVGLLWTAQPLVPDPNRVNPLSGLQRLFGLRGFVDGFKAIIKVTIVGWVVYGTLHGRLNDLASLGNLPLPIMLDSLSGVIYSLCLRAAVALCLIACFDYAYQRWDYEKNLRMTKEEVKQEFKQSEGDPLIKAAIRQRQRSMSQKRMMQDVPKADVVITNPTHFAVALQYDSHGMGAPRVIAKGMDLVAKRIREIAQENDVPLHENPPLARTLYKEVEVGQEIPTSLYTAVAEVLAYVYDRDRARRRR